MIIKCDSCLWCYKETDEDGCPEEWWCMYTKYHPPKKLIEKYGCDPKWRRKVRCRRIKNCKRYEKK